LQQIYGAHDGPVENVANRSPERIFCFARDQSRQCGVSAAGTAPMRAAAPLRPNSQQATEFSFAQKRDMRMADLMISLRIT